MKRSAIWILLFVILTAGGSILFPQQEIVLTIREGVPAISLALPPFISDTSSAEAREAAETIHQVLADDLRYSRVFSLVPREHLNYIRPLNPKEIFFRTGNQFRPEFWWRARSVSPRSGSSSRSKSMMSRAKE